MLKLIHDGHIKIFQSENLKQEHRYRYSYKYFNTADKIHIYESDKFPLELLYKTKGYLFIKAKRMSNKKIIESLPVLPNFEQSFNIFLLFLCYIAQFGARKQKRAVSNSSLLFSL